MLLTTLPLMLASILARIHEMVDLKLLRVHRVAFLLFDLCSEILLKEGRISRMVRRDRRDRSTLSLVYLIL